MVIPVLEGQQKIGAVSIREEGLYRVVTARVRLCPGLRRLWLCSNELGVCLGVLAPEGGWLHLKKRLSRRDWAALPQPLTHAALSAPAAPGESPAEPPSREQEAWAENSIRLFGQRFVVFRS